MYKGLPYLLLVFSSLLLPKISYAHPGRTASDGCHYCRTNCDKWGEVWNARHCHGGYSPSPTTYTAPVVTLKPTAIPTTKPTSTPKLTKTPTSIPTSTKVPTTKPTTQPEVKGASEKENTPTPIAESISEVDTESSNIGGTVGVLGAAGLGYYLYKQVKKRKGSEKF